MPTSPTTYIAPGVEVLFQSSRAGLDGQLVKHLVDFIEGTEGSLDVAIYDLRHPAVLAALAALTKRHVRLRLAYDGGQERTGGLGGDPKPGGTAAALAAAGLMPFATPVHEQGRHLMHDKFLVRDGKSVWVGSANFTVGGLELQDNNCVAVVSSPLATCYTAVMDGLLQPRHRHPRGSGTPPTIEVGGTPLSPYFEPADGEGIERAIAAAIKGARRIRIAAFLMSNPDILAALLPFADNPHADIAGVYDPHGMQDVLHYSRQNPKVFWFLQDPRFVAAPSHGFAPGREQDFMHNKVFVIDDHLVFTGSYNFSDNAEENDETVLKVDSPGIATAYTHYIETLIDTYKASAKAATVSVRAGAHPRHPASENTLEIRQPSGAVTPRLDQAIRAVVWLLLIGLVILAILIVFQVLHITG